MSTVILASLVLAHILVVWFSTDAFVEYSTLFGWDERCKVKQYLETKEDNPWSYPEFLAELYQEYFLVRLVTCPVCLATWLAVPISFFTGYLFVFPAVAFLGLLFYRLFGIVS